VYVTLPTPIRSQDDDVVIPPFDADPIILDEDGAFSIELPATTDPEWLPNTANYVVRVEFDDDFRKLWWMFPLPHDLPGGVFDLADAGEPNVGTPSLTIRQGTTQPLADGAFKGAWDDDTLYRTGDTVIHGSAVYGALRPSEGTEPGTDPTTWSAYPSGTLAAIGAATLLGNNTGVPAVPAALTTAQVKAMLAIAVGDVSGLAAALAGKLDLAGGTLTGGLTIENGDFQVEDTGTKGYRFRQSGGALDLDATGAKLFVSVFSGTDFDGTQRVYLVLESGASVAQAVGQWQWRQTADGTERHRIDALTGVASLGSKNGLTNLQWCGFKGTAGAPTTDTWNAGDLVIDSAGDLHLCTAGGTPGTWT
jgi:hypothetical protein